MSIENHVLVREAKKICKAAELCGTDPQQTDKFIVELKKVINELNDLNKLLAAK